MKKNISEITVSYQDWLIGDLCDKKEATAYLQAALAEYQNDGNAAALLLALRNVAKARGGIAALAAKSKLNRETLYRTLSKKGNPQLSTLNTVLHALGFQLSISAA